MAREASYNNNKRYHADIIVCTLGKIIIAKKIRAPDLRCINAERISSEMDRVESVFPL